MQDPSGFSRAAPVSMSSGLSGDSSQTGLPEIFQRSAKLEQLPEGSHGHAASQQTSVVGRIAPWRKSPASQTQLVAIPSSGSYREGSRRNLGLS